MANFAGSVCEILISLIMVAINGVSSAHLAKRLLASYSTLVTNSKLPSTPIPLGNKLTHCNNYY